MTKWQIFGAVALRKLPEVRPPLDMIESRVQQIFDLYETAKSKLSDHELQHIEDMKPKDNESLEITINETAQDKLDRWIKEKSAFEFGEYDERLTKCQYLFVKDKFGTDIKDQWLLPQAIYDSQLDSTLMDTARRALKNSLDIVNGFRIVSKIPSSVYKFKYPKKVAKLTGFDGAQVYYLKAHLDLPSASVLKALDCSDRQDKMKWVTIDEARKCASESYLGGLTKGLLHEDRVNVQEILVHAAKYVAEENLRREKLKRASELKQQQRLKSSM